MQQDRDAAVRLYQGGHGGERRMHLPARVALAVQAHNAAQRIHAGAAPSRLVIVRPQPKA
jgi:hypothetical protein